MKLISEFLVVLINFYYKNRALEKIYKKLIKQNDLKLN